MSDLSTERLSKRERFTTWCDQSGLAHAPVDIRTDHAADFRASLRLLDLGAVSVTTLTCPPLEAVRSPAMIRQSDPQRYLLLLNLGGAIAVSHKNRTATLGPGDLTLYDTSRPFEIRATTPSGDRAGEAARAEEARGAGKEGPVAALHAAIPRALLPVGPEQADRLLATRLRGDDPMASLLSRYLQELTRHADHYRAADTARLATTTLDLVTTVLAHTLDAAADGSRPASPPDTHRRALQSRIHAYIQRHLGDPELTPETVAAANQVSVRRLHQLFREQGLTVAGWIRQRRLERCRRDLADPQTRSRPISAIAARWGITDAAHFSRLFRSTYGIPPSEYRHIHSAHGYPRAAHASSTTWTPRTGAATGSSSPRWRRSSPTTSLRKGRERRSARRTRRTAETA